VDVDENLPLTGGRLRDVADHDVGGAGEGDDLGGAHGPIMPGVFSTSDLRPH
jgi:hypothetical protein